jgi:hypothetical protein
MFQTRSLIWWIGQNGKFPLDFQEPTGEEIEAMGIKGFQEMLLKADPEQVDVFEDSWVVHAESMQRVTMFSKVSPARVCVCGTCAHAPPDLLPILEERQEHSQAVQHTPAAVHYRAGHER